MAAEQKPTLFKDRITKSDYKALVAKLTRAVEAGDDALKLLLFGSEELDRYENHGSYEFGQHNHCGGLKGSSYTEKRLCKCLYYFNGEYRRQAECEKCDFRERYCLTGQYRITDYEVPAYYYAPGVGEIDLVLTDSESGISYAAEAKPDQGNDETLLRMVAEILTYTLGYPAEKYQKAIIFFGGTPQQEEYDRAEPDMRSLLKKAGITVFRFKKRGPQQYEICRL